MAGTFVFSEPDGSESVFVLLRNFMGPTGGTQWISGAQYEPDLHLAANKTVQALLEAKDWHVRPPVMEHPVPREVRWHQVDNVPYRYGNSADPAVAYPSELLALQEKLIRALNMHFNPLYSVSRTILTFDKLNSVLVNKYRDFKDSIGPHADDEPCFGLNPTIVSVNFGATRRFHLTRSKVKPANPMVGSKTTLDFELAHNDVLIMAGSAQKYWLHSVPKEPNREPSVVEFVPGYTVPTIVRFNLTFRAFNPDMQKPKPKRKAEKQKQPS